MKSVLISINPKWCELIASGEKTVEVRKSRPKLETPFKVYIYETKSLYKPNGCRCFYEGRGQVIGEFVCEKILESFLNNNDGWFVEKGCLTPEEIEKYQGDKAILYGWHITDLVIYDKPKELSEFYRYCGDSPKCDGCEAHYYSNTECGKEDYCCSVIDGCKPLKRPPQSWCYVEGRKS